MLSAGGEGGCPLKTSSARDCGIHLFYTGAEHCLAFGVIFVSSVGYFNRKTTLDSEGEWVNEPMHE